MLEQMIWQVCRSASSCRRCWLKELLRPANAACLAKHKCTFHSTIVRFFMPGNLHLAIERAVVSICNLAAGRTSMPLTLRSTRSLTQSQAPRPERCMSSMQKSTLMRVQQSMRLCLPQQLQLSKLPRRPRRGSLSSAACLSCSLARCTCCRVVAIRGHGLVP